jgi:mono/diheme cytochrome c family protein
MSKRTFISFGLLVLVLAVAIPWLAFRSNGQSLFEINCGTCHTLSSAGTDGNYGPDLDELLAAAGPPEGEQAAETIKTSEGRVLGAIENGVDSTTTPGRMPGGILNEEQAKEVSEFVARTAGEG